MSGNALKPQFEYIALMRATAHFPLSPRGMASFATSAARKGTAAYRHGLSAFQSVSHLTVLENITLRPRKLPTAEANALAEKLLRQVGLSDKRDALPQSAFRRSEAAHRDCTHTRKGRIHGRRYYSEIRNAGNAVRASAE